jgi:hypothetical protein
MLTGTTGTGLDTLVRIVADDDRLATEQTAANITDGVASVDAYNGLLVDAIRATGVVNDGVLSGGDLIDIGDHLRTEAATTVTALRGAADDGEDTGFEHLLGDRASERLFGRPVVDEILATLFELPDGADDEGFLLNEAGEQVTSLRRVAGWLEDLLADDLAAGTLVNPEVSFLTEGTTGTSLDMVVPFIWQDQALADKVSTADRETGAVLADRQNALIVEAVAVTGVATDGVFDQDDARLLNEYINFNYLDEWTAAHGRFFEGERSGWHLVVGFALNDEKQFGLDVGFDYFWDSLYHLGFTVRDGRLVDGNGELNVSFRLVGDWLNAALAPELERGVFDTQAAPPAGATWPTGRPLDDNFGPAIPPEHLDASLPANDATGTTLDRFVDLIRQNEVLRIDLGETTVDQVARAAEAMNEAIVAAVRATGVAADGAFSRADVEAVNAALVGRDDLDWTALRDPESGFDAILEARGGKVYLLGEPAFDGVMDKFYDLGFPLARVDSLGDAAGRPGIGLNKAKDYLNALFAEDLAAGTFENAVLSLPAGTTGTGLDVIVETIGADAGLADALAPAEIAGAMTTAAVVNGLLLEALDATGAANDARITGSDLIEVGAYLDAEHAATMAEAFGDGGPDATGLETIRDEGATSTFAGMPAIDRAFEAVWSAGFPVDERHFVRPDGKLSPVPLAAEVLDELLADDLAAGTLVNPDVEFLTSGTTGTGLDRIVDLVLDNPTFADTLATARLDAAVRGADAMNAALVDAIRATGVAADGGLSTLDVTMINSHLVDRTRRGEIDWAALRDPDDGDGIGYDAVLDTLNGGTRLFGTDPYNRVFDNIYNLGFATAGLKLTDGDGDGDTEAGVSAVRDYLNALLVDDFANGDVLVG